MNILSDLNQNNEVLNPEKKVAVIGMGYVGGGIVYSLMIKNIADTIVLIDKKADTINAEMLDIRPGISDIGTTKVITGSYKDIKDCDLIIITAGRNRKHNESRLDLTEDNIKVADDVIAELKKYYTKGVILVVTNPVDVITQYITKNMELPNGRVIGTGCILDTSRFVAEIAEYTSQNIRDIEAMVIGEHGTGQVHLWESVKIKGLPVKDFCSENNIKFDNKIQNSISQKIVNMGSEIIYGKGRTHFGTSSCVTYLANSILNNKEIIVPISVMRNGEYGINNISLSLPTIINANGAGKTINVNLNKSEEKQLKVTADKLFEVCRKYC